MPYTGPERRQHKRIGGRFIVSYRVIDKSETVDITQTKNLSMGGMLLTTNKKFEPGVDLLMEIRLPFDPNPIMLIGKVVESHEVTKNLIYDTRICFGTVNNKKGKIICDTVDYYLKKG